LRITRRAVEEGNVGSHNAVFPVTHLRKMMLEELERRNYSESTKRAYVQTIEDLARYFMRPPDQLEPAHIRQYQAYLLRDRKLSPNTVNQRTGALRFFFITVLKKSWSIADTPANPQFISHIRIHQNHNRSSGNPYRQPGSGASNHILLIHPCFAILFRFSYQFLLDALKSV